MGEYLYIPNHEQQRTIETLLLTAGRAGVFVTGWREDPSGSPDILCKTAQPKGCLIEYYLLHSRSRSLWTASDDAILFMKQNKANTTSVRCEATTTTTTRSRRSSAMLLLLLVHRPFFLQRLGGWESKVVVPRSSVLRATTASSAAASGSPWYCYSRARPLRTLTFRRTTRYGPPGTREEATRPTADPVA